VCYAYVNRIRNNGVFTVNLPSTGTIYTVKDQLNRPLVILRRSTNGKLLYILNRYLDMTENDKEVVRTSYQVALRLQSIDGDISNIEDFLSFSENKPCG
jgi:predicted nucleotidyltransferase component of viral defense system